MKKVYEKPQVYMERFELAEHIAGCSVTWNSDHKSAGDPKTCEAIVDLGDGYIVPHAFFDASVCCDSGVMEAYCYTNGSLDVAIINS